jgi:hypothetical protein
MLIYEPKEYPKLNLVIGTPVYDYLSGDFLGKVLHIADSCLVFYGVRIKDAVFMNGLSSGFFDYYFSELPISVKFRDYKISRRRIKC